MIKINEILNIEKAPERIVSLVPSQTELLYHLGLDRQTAGITKFCIHPGHWFRSKQRIGGTKTVNIEKVKMLQPDLILANKEENRKEDIEALQDIAPLWVSDIKNLGDALDMIKAVGRMTHKLNTARRIVRKIEQRFSRIGERQCTLKVLYLIWREPWMTIGGDTFIHDILCHAGMQNVFGDESRYISISAGQMQEKQPDIVLLSSEPYPFKEKHIKEVEEILPQARIMLTDGEMFSWYGSRILKTPAYLLRHFPQDTPFCIRKY